MIQFPKESDEEGLEAPFKFLSEEAKNWTQCVLVSANKNGAIEVRFVNPTTELLAEAALFLAHHAVAQRQQTRSEDDTQRGQGKGADVSELTRGEDSSDVSH